MKILWQEDRWVWGMLPLMLFALYMDFLGSPDDRTLGASQRIFYFHMGAAAVVPVAVTISAAASAGYMFTRNWHWDIWAAASAEIGTVFTSMVLLSGTLWGRAAWGIWWTWDPRLTSTLILWMLFAGYLLLRESTDNIARQATYSAVLAIVAYIDVPVDYMAIRWWHSIHPVVITVHGMNMAPSMAEAMGVSIAAMLFLFGAWLVVRIRLLRAEFLIGAAKQTARLRWL
jgi:heme exporter protein C